MYSQTKESSNELQHVMQEDVKMDRNAKEKLESVMQEDADMDREAKDPVGAAMNFGSPNNCCDVEEGWKHVLMDNGDAQADGPGDMIYIVLSIIGVFAACFMIMKSYGYPGSSSENESAGYLSSGSENKDAGSFNDLETSDTSIKNLCDTYNHCDSVCYYESNVTKDMKQKLKLQSLNDRLGYGHKPRGGHWDLPLSYQGKNLALGEYCHEEKGGLWYCPKGEEAINCAMTCVDMNKHSSIRIKDICSINQPPLYKKYETCSSECVPKDVYDTYQTKLGPFKPIWCTYSTGPCNEKENGSKLWYCPNHKVDHCNDVCLHAVESYQTNGFFNY